MGSLKDVEERCSFPCAATPALLEMKWREDGVMMSLKELVQPRPSDQNEDKSKTGIQRHEDKDTSRESNHKFIITMIKFDKHWMSGGAKADSSCTLQTTDLIQARFDDNII